MLDWIDVDPGPVIVAVWVCGLGRGGGRRSTSGGRVEPGVVVSAVRQQRTPRVQGAGAAPPLHEAEQGHPSRVGSEA